MINIEGGRSAHFIHELYESLTETSRHILQELTVGAFVANDTFLVGGAGSQEPEQTETDPSSRPTSQMPPGTSAEEIEDPSMLIMTGPNFSGKSIYLKQVAVIVYMAHVGW